MRNVFIYSNYVENQGNDRQFRSEVASAWEEGHVDQVNASFLLLKLSGEHTGFLIFNYGKIHITKFTTLTSKCTVQ